MTYNVFSGTLNSTQSVNQTACCDTVRMNGSIVHALVVAVCVFSQYVCRWLVLRQAKECLAFVLLHAMNWLTFLATASVSCLQEILLSQSKMYFTGFHVY